MLLLVVTPAYAITNAQMIDYLKVEIVQSGFIESVGPTSKIEFVLSIPQEDKYQTVESIEVNSDYVFVTDKYGNKNLKIIWDNPSSINEFEVKSIVTVQRRDGSDFIRNVEYLQSSSLVESDDPNIISLAERFQGNEFERIAQVTKWVHDNIEYDMKYASVNKSATWVLENRKGVCDELTILTLALTRSMGYNSAYIVGYAFGQGTQTVEDFIPHGWAEIENYAVDTTWAEAGYVDGTHIKFATLPDAQYVQASVNSIGGGGFRVTLGPINTKIKILDSTESSAIKVISKPLDSTIENGYIVIQSQVSSDKCILSKIGVSSCVNSEGEAIFTDGKVFYTCDNKNVFHILKLDNRGSSLSSFNCPITVSPYFDRYELVPIIVSFRRMPKIDLVLSKTLLSPGESYDIVAEDSHIFTNEGDYGFDVATFKAPNNDFVVYGYKDGTLVSQEIVVVNDKPIDVFMNVSENTVKVVVSNLKGGSQEVTVKIGNETQTKEVFIEETFVFETVGTFIQANVITENFSTTLSKKLVSEKYSTGSNIFTIIIEFLKKLFSGFV